MSILNMKLEEDQSQERDRDTDQIFHELNYTQLLLSEHVDKLHEAVTIMRNLQSGGLQNLAVDEFIERYDMSQTPISIDDDLPF